MAHQTCALMAVGSTPGCDRGTCVLKQDTLPYLLLFTRSKNGYLCGREMDAVLDSRCSVENGSAGLYTPQGADDV